MSETSANSKPQSLFKALLNRLANSDKKESIPESVTRKLLEEAVLDAQHMIIYASADHNKKIDRKTIETLSKAKQRLEMGEKLSPEDDADFWLAYQELCHLMAPFTVESIKANLPLEKVFFGKLLGWIPFLSRWTSTWTISRARRKVNQFIVFTIFVLLLVLFF